MSESPRVAWFNGRLVPFAEAVVPIEDRGLQFAESLYEVVVVAAGAARHLDDHAGRMRAGAGVLGIERGLPPATEWHRIVERLQAEERLTEGLLYAQLTGGSWRRQHVPDGTPSPNFFAYLRRFRFPRAAEVEAGIAVVSEFDPRWARCDVKTTMLAPAVLSRRAAAARGAQEVLYLGPDGLVREGAASNLFVVEGTTLKTPPQSHNLLPGLTRPLIAGLAARAGLTVLDEPLTLARLHAADEVFITSSTVLVMPVTAVDGQPAGGGAAGPIAIDLARRLRLELELPDA